jgi:hypothetical protein
MKTYQAFGLIIKSELEIPNLLMSEADRYDVHLQVGTTPRKIENPWIETDWGQWNGTQCLFHIHETARYFVQDGKTIIVEPFSGTPLQTIVLWLLGSVMAALLHQRGILPLHASAVATSQGALLIGGDSGVGKSTLAAAFLQQGYQLLTDDVSAISYDDQGQIIVFPGYPQQKLWQDTLDEFRLAIGDLKPIDYYKSKYFVPRHDRFWQTALPIRALYIMSDYDSQFEIKLLEGISKFQSIGQQIYRPYFMPRVDSSNRQSKILMTLGAYVPVIQVQGHKQNISIEALTEICLRHLE